MLLGYLAPACWFLAAAACFSCLKFQRPPRHLIQHDEGKVQVDYFQTVRHESDLSTNDSFGCKTAGLDQGEFQVSSDWNSSMCHVSMESMFTLSTSVSIHVPFLGALQLAPPSNHPIGSCIRSIRTITSIFHSRTMPDPRPEPKASC